MLDLDPMENPMDIWANTQGVIAEALSYMPDPKDTQLCVRARGLYGNVPAEERESSGRKAADGGETECPS